MTSPDPTANKIRRIRKDMEAELLRAQRLVDEGGNRLLKNLKGLSGDAKSTYFNVEAPEHRLAALLIDASRALQEAIEILPQIFTSKEREKINR